MSKQKSLSKKIRFDVFKRDEFTCQYCGRTPPTVILEVDHVVAISKGGANDEHNLLTACFDCNRGKGAGNLETVPIDYAEKIKRLKEKKDQLTVYNKLLVKHKKETDASAQRIVDIYDVAYEGWSLTASAKISINRFLGRLPEMKVIEAMELACSRMDKNKAFKYFCGICWNMVRADLP